MSTPASVETPKLCHTILLDTSPLLLNQPSISTLLSHSHVLLTTPSVISEIRGEEARSRINTLYLPFLTIRSPTPESMKIVRDFARRTGDAAVLSQTDYEVLGLAYEVECERNGGNWRLRSVPGQKRLNGRPPSQEEKEVERDVGAVREGMNTSGLEDLAELFKRSESVMQNSQQGSGYGSWTLPTQQRRTADGPISTDQERDAAVSTAESTTEPLVEADDKESTGVDSTVLEGVTEEASSDSDEGWITPSNIKKKQAEDEAASNSSKSEVRTLQVATMTGDFAMQNVLLQMNLNLLSTKTCKRIANIKQMILRCHACFATTKDMSKQFCARCGKPTLTRVTCTTNDKGEVKLHLKANMQWNNRGNVFSVPKPTSGSANQRWKGPRQGGGQNGWGNDLLLAEDQKEYVRAASSMKKAKNKDLMDEDMLPSILTGDRDRPGGRLRVGGGRNINSRKR